MELIQLREVPSCSRNIASIQNFPKRAGFSIAFSALQSLFNARFFSNIHSVYQSAGYGSRYVTESINMNRSRSLFGVLAKDAMVGHCAINSTNFVLQNELYQMCWCIRQLATDDVQPPKSVAPQVHRRLSESEVDAVELHADGKCTNCSGQSHRSH